MRRAVLRAPRTIQRHERSFSSTGRQRADFTHCVIGAGAVGLATARRLAQHPGTSVLLVEKHRAVGTETSSRNSEVVHAGLYYPADSLKTQLCLEGKRLLYELCEARGVPIRRCGKWIVAQDEVQRDALEKVHAHAQGLGKITGTTSDEMWAETRWVGEAEAKTREPAVRAAAGALESLSTGILDSHEYMQLLSGDFEDAGGTLAIGTQVLRLEGLGSPVGADGWRVYVKGEGEEESMIETETLVNSAGLYAIAVSNMALPAEEARKPFYAKGTYYSYAASSPKPSTLVYPAPVAGHAGLGTHLTLDMGGRVRFGPDVQWVESPTDLAPNDAGFEAALDDIQTYLPGLKRDAVSVDYCGIRPKLRGPGKGFQDFYIKKEESVSGFVNLLGIESPGLTSSMAIAEYVHGLLYK